MDYLATIARWAELQEILPRLKAEEQALREGIFNGTFPNPEEGAKNQFQLPDGSILKATHNINRKILKPEALLVTYPAIVKAEYSLRVGDYKKLPEADRHNVDQVLEIKPGLCKLELIPPKER